MGLPFHCIPLYISECRNTAVLLRHLSIIQKPLILSMELKNIRRLWKKLIESEIKTMEVLEKHTQYWEMIHQFYPNKRYRKAPPIVRHTDKKNKKHQIGPCNWKTLKNHSSNQGNAATA